MPFLKLTSKKDSKLGSYDAMEITGIDLGKNEEWTKKFFKGKQNTHLVEAMDDIEVGDEINVVMEQDPKNSKWWNIKEISLMTDEDRSKLERKQSFTKGGAKPAAGAPTSVRRADGGSRGDDTNRSAAIYLTKDIIEILGDNRSSEDVIREMIYLADTLIYPYIKDGTIPTPREESAKTSIKRRELPTTKV
jgi:hypothetical protein